jgi:hypothetical protein
MTLPNLSHLTNHVNSVRYATDLAYIWNSAYDILAEAWDLERGGVMGVRGESIISVRGRYLFGKSPEGAESCKILSREGKYDVQQSQYRANDWCKRYVGVSVDRDRRRMVVAGLKVQPSERHPPVLPEARTGP